MFFDNFNFFFNKLLCLLWFDLGQFRAVFDMDKQINWVFKIEIVCKHKLVHFNFSKDLHVTDLKLQLRINKAR